MCRRCAGSWNSLSVWSWCDQRRDDHSACWAILRLGELWSELGDISSHGVPLLGVDWIHSYCAHCSVSGILPCLRVKLAFGARYWRHDQTLHPLDLCSRQSPSCQFWWTGVWSDSCDGLTVWSGEEDSLPEPYLPGHAVSEGTPYDSRRWSTHWWRCPHLELASRLASSQQPWTKRMQKDRWVMFLSDRSLIQGEILVVCAWLVCLCFSKPFNSRMHGSFFHLLDHCEQSRLVMFKTFSNV